MLAKGSARPKKTVIAGSFSSDTVLGMTVFTFFTPVKSPERVVAYRRLLRVWRRLWAEAGFNPVVVEPKGSKEPQRLSELAAAFAKSVTVNVREYEWTCYARWAYVAEAAARFKGPILAVDGDVFPNPACKQSGFLVRPADFWNGDFHVLDVGNNPCAVLTDSVSCEDWIDELVREMPTCRTLIGDREHTSDMVVCQHTQPAYPLRLCAPFGHPTGSEYPLIHVGTEIVKELGEDEFDKAGFVLRRVGSVKRWVRK